MRKFLAPPTARVIRDEIEFEIDIHSVVIGDHVHIHPAEKAPVDGRVLEGTSAIDESLVTGGPIPADKGEAAEVTGGSINQAGTLLVEATRVGEDSIQRQLARHVEEAKAMKPDIIVLVDRVLKYYVPVVLTISVLSLLFWDFVMPEAWSDQPRHDHDDQDRGRQTGTGRSRPRTFSNRLGQVLIFLRVILRAGLRGSLRGHRMGAACLHSGPGGRSGVRGRYRSARSDLTLAVHPGRAHSVAPKSSARFCSVTPSAPL